MTKKPGAIAQLLLTWKRLVRFTLENLTGVVLKAANLAFRLPYRRRSKQGAWLNRHDVDPAKESLPELVAGRYAHR